MTSHPGSEQILSPLTGSSFQSIGPADMLWLRSYRTHFRCFCLDRSALASPRSIRYRCIRLRKILTVGSFQISISNILAPYRKASRRIWNHAGFLGSYRLLRPTRGLTPQETARVAGLVRISKLGQVLADQTGELSEIVHGVRKKGNVLPAASKNAVQLALIPCTMNLKTLTDTFPQINDPVNQAMRQQDDILRDTITRQYQGYLDRFASHKTHQGVSSPVFSSRLRGWLQQSGRSESPPGFYKRYR
ncbi:MAG: hypothetical protein METHP_01743 [Methanoregula sp. SKADARSKE-2]|nr:MAG: hypothetical protein METHP_01743 [Methanoregula sp. SKADARSKE-2]